MLIHLLVQAGASVNFPDRRGNTSIHLAAQRKNVSVLQILSQSENHPPDYNIRNFSGRLANACTLMLTDLSFMLMVSVGIYIKTCGIFFL